MNLLSAHRNVAVTDFHSVSIVSIGGNLDAAAGYGGSCRTGTVIDGEAIIIQGTVASRNAGKAGKLLGQFNIQAVAISVLHDTDVAIREFCCIGLTASELQGRSHAHSNCIVSPIVTLEDTAAGYGCIGRITGNTLHIADVGGVGVVAGIVVDDAALHVGDVLAPCIDAGTVYGYAAGLDGAVIS